MASITVKDANQDVLLSESSNARINLPDRAATVTEIDLQGSSIVSTSRVGDDLIIKLANGKEIVLEDYFIDLPGDSRHKLLVDSGEGLAELSLADSTLSAPLPEGASGEIATSSVAASPVLGAIAGLLGLGAAAGAAGDSSEPAPSPTVLSTTDSDISGIGEPGATVSIDTDGDGEADLIALVDEEGNWEAEGEFEHGDELSVMQTLESGAESLSETITVDLEAPDAPTIDPTDGDVISGTGEPGATVSVFIEGFKEPLTAVVDEDGNWSIDPDGDLPHGTGIAATQTDALGNESEAAEAETDSEPPEAPEIDPTNGDLIEGSSEPFATVEISIPDQDPVTVEADEEGYWSYTPETPLADGVVVSATQTDLAGNTSEASEETVDAVAPEAPTIDPTNGDDITGTGEPFATVSITYPGPMVQLSAVVDEDGNWSVTSPTVIPHDTVLSATQTDPAGNTSEVTEETVDGEAPDAPVIDPTQGDVITGTGEAGTTLSLQIDGIEEPFTTVVGEDGTWSVDPDPETSDFLPHATELVATLTDPAGNTSDETEGATDSEPPAAPVIDPTQGDVITGTGEAGTTLSLEIEGIEEPFTTVVGEDGTWSVDPDPETSDFLPHATDLVATLTDPAGNTSDETEGATDSEPPAAPVIDPTQGDVITGTGEAGTTLSLEIEGIEEPFTTVVGEDGTWSVDPDPETSDFLPHATELVATLTDPAGNTSDETEGATDSEPPAAPVIDPTQGDVITGTGEAGTTLSLEIEGIEEPFTTVVGEDGTWSVDPDPETSDFLPHATELLATLTDPAGNTSDETEGATDSEPPAAPVIDPTQGDVITGTGEAGTTVTLQIEGVGTFEVETDEAGVWSYTPAVKLPHETGLIAALTDPAGNTSDETVAATDSEAPDAPEFNPASDVAISGQGEPSAIVSVTFEGLEEPMTAEVDEDGNWEIASEDIPEGIEDETVLIGTQSDPAGNTSTFSTEVVDAVHPFTPTIEPTDGTEISGTGEPGTVLTLAFGEETLTTEIDEDGNWSITPEEQLPHNTALTATSEDDAGNVSEPVTETTDSEAPEAPVINPSDGTEITGKGEADATVSLDIERYDDPVIVEVDEDGDWSFTPDEALADGTGILADQTDAAGNTSLQDSEVVDAVAPDTPTLEPTNGTSLSGTGEPFATVEITYAGLAEPLTAVVDEEGNWEINELEIPDGTVVFASQIDDAGNQSGPVTETVDGQAPDAPPFIANANTATGTGEPGATVEVSDEGDNVIGTAIVDEDGNWSAELDPVAAHEDQLTATQTDAAGNESDEAAATVDAQGPAAPEFTTSSTQAVGDGGDEPGTTIFVFEPDGETIGTTTVDEDGNWSADLDPAFVDGTELTATATDAAGNQSDPASATIDDIAPDSLVFVANSTTATGDGTAEPFTTVSLYGAEGTVLLGTAEVDEDGNWQIDIDPALADGVEVTATLTDAVGNVSDDGEATVDAIAPVVVINELVTGLQTELSGTGDPLTDIELFDSEDNSLGTTVTDSEGNWTLTPPEPLAEGTEVSASQTDASGNVGTTDQIVQLDTDADGVASTIDIDDDGDGILDANETSASIENGSFEEDAGGLQTSLVGWTTTGDFDVGDYTPTDGVNAIDLNGFETGTISQTIATEPGKTYTLSFDYRPNLGGAADRTFEVNALDGSSVLSTREITGENTEMQRGYLTFTATGTETIIEFNSLESGESGTFLDNIAIGDADGDGLADSLDTDSDGSGISDNAEAQYAQTYVAPSGVDSDGDGLDDAYDDNLAGAAGSIGLIPADTNGDGLADFLDGEGSTDTLPITLAPEAVGLDTVIAGEGVVGATITLTDADENELGTTTVGEDGTWSITPENPIADSSELTATQSDADHVPGATSAVTETVNIDSDGDGVIDTLDIDDDNDGILDTVENTPPPGSKLFGEDADLAMDIDPFSSSEAQEVVNALFGQDVTPFVSNVSILGANADGSQSQIGFMTDLPTSVADFSTAVVFGSGGINNLGSSTSNSSGSFTVAGLGGSDPDFNDGNGAFDVARVEFDITLTQETEFSGEYVFASDEYLEFINSGFTDGALILVDGVNVALAADGSDVTINTVNLDENASQFVNNSGGAIPFEPDGLTTTLSFSTTLGAGTHTIKLGVADRGDASYDSWFFFNTGSFDLAGVTGLVDTDEDSVVQALDLDSDGDGIFDIVEAGGVDANGDGKVDDFIDLNGNGLDDGIEASEGADTGLTPPDTDGDELADFADTVFDLTGANISEIGTTITDDGGHGEINFTGAGITLDLTGIDNGVFTKVETIDLSGTGINTLKLDLADLVDLSPDSDALFINGDADDTVEAVGGFSTNGSQIVDGVTYDIYVNGSASLLVEEDVTVTLS